MNQWLCPDEFEIHVPQASTLLGRQWRDPQSWRRYLGHLDKKYRIEVSKSADECTSCEGKLSWRLRGKDAIAHAREVHEHIYRKVLGLEQVSAIDVGFALLERQRRFGNFLAIRVHVNRKQPPERLIEQGFASFTQPTHLLESGFSSSVNRSTFEVSPSRSGAPRGGPSKSLTLALHLPAVPEELEKARAPAPQECVRSKRTGGCQKHLERLFARSCRANPRLWEQPLQYPIGGVGADDLSIFLPLSIEETKHLDQVRLCLCGVPIDIVNAQYRPAVTHPGGDARSGVFVGVPQTSNELPNDENLLIGRGRVNPVVGGISVGSVTSQAGTLSTIVWDRTDGMPCMLSNWHVLAGSPGAQVGQPIFQPALFDGGTEDDVVARLKRWHIGEDGDAALAELTHDRAYATGEILGLWSPVAGYLAPELNMTVRKWGRSTGFTQGFIDGIALATNIDYGNQVVRFFRDQFHIAPLFIGDDVSQTGDSGSLVVTSLAPLQMRSDLEDMRNWLEACCDSHGAFTLFAELPRTLEAYRIQCKKNGQGCEPMRKLLEELEKEVAELEACVEAEGRDGDDPTACSQCKPANSCSVLTGLLGGEEPSTKKCKRLECFLIDASNKLDVTSEKIRCDLEALTFLEAKCSRLHEVYCVRHDCEPPADPMLSKLWQQIEEKCSAYLSEEDSARPFKKNKAKRSTAVCGSDPLTLCRWLETALQLVRKAAQQAEACVALIAEIGKTLERWQQRCKRVPEAETRFTSLCKALHCLADAEDLSQGPTSKNGDEDEARRAGRLIDHLLHCEEKNRHSDATSFVRSLRDALSADERAGKSAHDGSERSRGDQQRCELWKKSRQRVRQVIDDWILDADIDIGDPSRFELLQALDDILPARRNALRVLIEKAAAFVDEERDRRARRDTRSYFAVGMIFAGDTPGSPFGEFAVASDIAKLEKELRFSLRPVYEPRSSFRELRVRPDQQQLLDRAIRTLAGLQPGVQSADPRGGGPQPEIEPAQSSASGGKS